MSKKIIGIFMSLIVATSLAGCGSAKASNEEKESTTEATTEITTIEEADGTWAKNYTLDETKKLYSDKAAKVESITKAFNLKYSKDEVIKKEENQTITDNSIYFDNENPDANKIESMYFGLKLYGENLEEGQISLKLTLNFDSESAIKNNDFDLGKTSFAKYIEAFTGQENRDYSQINKEIMEKLKNGESDVKITDTIDGLNEEIIATKDCIFYKLSTKKYKFSDAEMSME